MSTKAGAPRKAARVLIVDDSPLALHLLQSALEHAHYDVVTATSVNDAFEKVAESRPDVVVTDGVMPGADGLALVRRLREQPATKQIPVIMVTASEPSESQRERTGPLPDAFVRKAANLEPLLVALSATLERSRKPL